MFILIGGWMQGCPSSCVDHVDRFDTPCSGIRRNLIRAGLRAKPHETLFVLDRCGNRLRRKALKIGNLVEGRVLRRGL